MGINPGMFSSDTPHWATPDGIYDELDREFHFTMDPCPLHGEGEGDGLEIPWVGSVFVNPPYGQQIASWIAKGWVSAQAGATVVLLLPSRTDTAWWHNYCMKGEIRFIRGRLKFGGAKNSAPFPSAIVIFRPSEPPDAN